ncbi:MAG TPA: sigma 54-interacting transcriptional regulator [Pyrinomonadaceae bacterium]|nr:sigma 54-interacting transcriptional regulator [Pyrinomonadaceae bacterium]
MPPDVSFEAQAPPSSSAVRRYQNLLAVTEAVISHRELPDLFRALAAELRRVARFDYIAVLLHDPERGAMRLHLQESDEPSPVEPGWEIPVGESAGGWVWQTQQPLVVHDLSAEERFPAATSLLRASGINSYYVFPLTSAGRRLGALGFGCKAAHACDEGEIEFLRLAAKQAGLAVDNALNFRSAQEAQRQLARERDRLRLLLEVNNAVVASLDLNEVFASVSENLRRVTRHDYASLSLYDEARGELEVRALDFAEGRGFVREGMRVRLEDTPTGLAVARRAPVLLGRADIERYGSEYAGRVLAEGLSSACIVPLVSHERVLGTLAVANLRGDAYTEEDAEFLARVGTQIAIAVENALSYREVESLKNKLSTEKVYLEEVINSEYSFEEIIGHSAALRRILREVETVAPTDSAVLITGETGTGKELIARAIHDLSGRREHTMVKVNCAAIPTGLLESELFGHERGAFTGAIAQRTGRFEVAHLGTLFLDEVGDIPLELQAKLLRVLQEREFERLGSSRTVRVDVRLIAATHRDLARMVAEGSFRPDLFYRLNVFPVAVPPLRERAEDIPLLVGYFAQKYSRQMKKRIEMIPSEELDALSRYPWPGNIRELQNLVERAVILARGTELRIPLGELKPPAAAARSNDGRAGARLVTMEEMERDYIREVLRHTGGVVGGRGGAAEILGLPVSTLRSRMKKLGLK